MFNIRLLAGGRAVMGGDSAGKAAKIGADGVGIVGGYAISGVVPARFFASPLPRMGDTPEFGPTPQNTSRQKRGLRLVAAHEVNAAPADVHAAAASARNASTHNGRASEVAGDEVAGEVEDTAQNNDAWGANGSSSKQTGSGNDASGGDDASGDAVSQELEPDMADEDANGVGEPLPPTAAEIAKANFLQVLQRAKEGDRKAFEEIFQLYHRRIYNAVYGMLGDPDDAQDVTQDVFLRLHDALPTLRADEAFSTYLYRIALNLCRDRARRKKRVRFQSMDTPRADSEGEMEPMEFPDPGKLPEETLTGDELQKRVRQAVQNLSEDHKAVIVMHHFQGMEVNDIAGILGVPTGTVKSRLARGRDQLHRKLRGYLGAA